MLQGLNPSKASGPDQIPPWFLKLTASEIAPVLTNIFQNSLNTAEIPKDWRDANICAIFKKGDRAVPSNYRPVSLTCISCKLLEHIIHSQIMKHLESYSILTDYQHGFRAKRSTETQLILTVHDIAGALNSKRQVDLAILDFTKAFDKVPHARLISKLEYYGIQGPTLNWLKAFLTNREQTVVVEGKASAPVKVASGVPQGTVLGPLLFLLYINDLPDQLDSNVRLFADDCLLYVELSTQTDSQLLQKDLNTLEEWQSKWLMQFNPEKCYIMHITNKRTPHATSYQFCGQALAITKIHPYLGVTLTSGLKSVPVKNTYQSPGRADQNQDPRTRAFREPPEVPQEWPQERRQTLPYIHRVVFRAGMLRGRSYRRVHVLQLAPPDNAIVAVFSWDHVPYNLGTGVRDGTACQGDKDQTVAECAYSDSKPSPSAILAHLSTEADSFLARATVPGIVAYKREDALTL
ncbi:hypothetical protein Bbelb_109720 [Branchiostoma belcheri]|nr:hypothetical protein Bbelb_109720 [Branchiostoma belcheri]